MKQRTFAAAILAVCSTIAALPATPCGDCELSVPTDTLVPLVFQPLILGSIKPAGWLNDQLQLMANGLAGHEHAFYSYVALSSWLGQDQEYSALNEGFPYWFNGLVPLAYGLGDERLKEQVHSAASIVLDRQAADGWIGPETGTARNLWGRMPFLLGLTQLAEANATWEKRAVPAMHRFLQLMHSMLADNYTGYVFKNNDRLDEGNYQWGRVRSQDMMISQQWLYSNHPQNNSQLLLDNMWYLYNGSINWAAWYTPEAYIFQDLYEVSPDYVNANFPYEHGVNVGQGLKAAAVYRRFTHNDSLIQTAFNGVNWTFNYHGAASGTILADERLVGLSPYYGSELCTVVETMYSLSYLYQSLGLSYYADRAELAAFNALPAMLTPDWWAHQYVEQPNQPYAIHLAQTPFWNVNSWGQTFGLEPQYPCCTVNHPQGFPKFLSATYVRIGPNGLAHALLSPANVSTKLQSGQVSVDCDTKYPFGDTLSYIINAAAPFDFYVRVPGWYVASSSSINGQPLSPDASSGLHRISLPAGESHITYTIGSNVVTTPRANDTIAVTRGALLYAVEIGSMNTSTIPKNWANQSYYSPDYAPAQSRDWQYHNTTAWNYAIDPSTLQYHSSNSNGRLANPIFAPDATPGYMTAQACQIDWPLFKSVPGAAPPLVNRTCLSSVQQVKLVPYGAAKLHMAELPTIQLPRGE